MKGLSNQAIGFSLCPAASDGSFSREDHNQLDKAGSHLFTWQDHLRKGGSARMDGSGNFREIPGTLSTYMGLLTLHLLSVHIVSHNLSQAKEDQPLVFNCINNAVIKKSLYLKLFMSL